MAIPVKTVTYAILAFSVLSWVVFLAGNTTLQREFQQVPDAAFTFGRELFIHRLLGYSWWSTWLTFALLASTIAASATGTLHKASRVLSLMATACFVIGTLVCENTAVWETLNDEIQLTGSVEQKFDVWLAGSIMITTCCALLMIWLGALDTILAPPVKDAAMSAAQYAQSTGAAGKNAVDRDIAVEVTPTPVV